ncbi:heavy metal sensor histidine kinase [Massilia sp. S19_KUP03_FR1]|uniref:heavy metal sensor histidine kinase n=1 Tax=Massilia sp. S19_KUP03_FR1 TaxID=3025503 RepID=UPI002FCDB5A1
MKPSSLTTRLACLFALLCMTVLGVAGMMLYRGLETQLTLRDDAALVTRVKQIRALLQDQNTLQLLHDRPRLFENMMANREVLLVLRFPGEQPLIDINPGGIAVPDLVPVASDVAVSLTAVQRSIDAHGTPFSALAANLRTGQAGRELRITAGRLMGERTRILDNYRQQVVWMALGGSVLAAAVAFILVRRGMRPLGALAAHAASIGIDNLGARLDAARAPRELAPLVAALNAMLERLAGGFSRLSQVTEDMAHDLRTPIGTLLGQTEVALGQARSADYYHALLVSNQEELQRLSRMTANMLFLARADHADTMIEPARLDIAAEFARVADYFEGLAEERGLRIEIACAGQVWADPMLLRRAMANLLANAVHYADAPSTIVLSSRADADGVTLAVENAGPPIAPHQLARLFDRFYRADAARRDSSQSSGLGLAIVRTIMALHDGSAQAASSDGINRFSLHFRM